MGTKPNKLQGARAEFERISKELSERQIKNDVDVTTVAFKLNNFYDHFIHGIEGDDYDHHDVQTKIKTNLASAMGNIKKNDSYTFGELDRLKYEILMIIEGIIIEAEQLSRENELKKED